MATALTFAIGDIHGCFDELRSLLELCTNAGGVEHDFVFLGDYVDRGPASNEVVAYLMQAQAASLTRFRCMLGNHDDMLCIAADRARDEADLIRWWANGGEATLDSYGIGDPADLPAEHLAWLQALPVCLHERDRFFVHAGIRPGVPLDAQWRHDLLWIREPFLSSEAWHGAFVVHGHTPTPTSAPDLRPNRVNLDTGACFGRALTAAAFSPTQSFPAFFVNSDGLRFEARAARGSHRT